MRERERERDQKIEFSKLSHYSKAQHITLLYSSVLPLTEREREKDREIDVKSAHNQREECESERKREGERLRERYSRF